MASPRGAWVSRRGLPKARLWISLIARTSLMGNAASSAKSQAGIARAVSNKNSRRFMTSSIGQGAADAQSPERKFPRGHVQILVLGKGSAQVDFQARQER